MEIFPAYPMFLELAQRPVLVVGGGYVGLRKTRSLREYGARVTVVSPVFSIEFGSLGDVECVTARYGVEHMMQKAWRLVFAATNATEVNCQVQKDAEGRGIFCCRTDDPEAGNFSSGATQRLNGAGGGAGLVLAVSTGGASPVLAARVCKEAAAGVDPILPAFADLLLEWRGLLKGEILEREIRRQMMRRVAGEEMEEILRRQGAVEARRVFGEWFEEARRASRAVTIGSRKSAEGEEGN